MPKDQPNVPVKESGERMKMGVKDRLTVPQLFPRQGSLMAGRIMRDISEKTELSQQEMKAVGMKEMGEGKVWWDDKKEAAVGQKNIKFSEAEIGFLKDQVKRLDELKQITGAMFALCERFHNIKSKEEKEGKEGQAKNQGNQDN